MTVLLVTKPENVQLIQPPIRIMGSTFVRFPFSISVIMFGSVIGFCATGARFCVLKNPETDEEQAYKNWLVYYIRTACRMGKL